MFTFGKSSRKRLDTLHLDLQRLMLEAIETSPLDFSILCGHRDEKEQTKAFNSKYSLVEWPNSRHNAFPSEAVDIAPFYASSPHIRWRNIEDFEKLAEHIKQVAERLKIDIEWGGDWETLKDYPHFQLKAKKVKNVKRNS